MKAALLLVGVALCGACSSGPQPALRPSIPEHGPMQQPRAPERAERSSAGNELATDEFLLSEAERARLPDPPPPPRPESDLRYVERPVYVQDEYDVYREQGGPSFPWNTAFGAGVGAIIGHQSGHRDEGAAVGAAIGLLLDVSTWR